MPARAVQKAAIDITRLPAQHGIMLKTAMEWIEELRLAPHPEGGWFCRVFASECTVNGARPAMTSIYYLLQQDDFSALHRLKSDEQWHFYSGSPITIHEIDTSGMYTGTTLARICHELREISAAKQP